MGAGRSLTVGALTAAGLVASLVVPAGSSSAAAPACNNVGAGDSLVCIRIDNGPASHKVTVWYDQRGGDQGQIRLGYTGVDGELHWDDGLRTSRAGEITGFEWNFGHPSPASCAYRGFMEIPGIMSFNTPNACA